MGGRGRTVVHACMQAGMHTLVRVRVHSGFCKMCSDTHSRSDPWERSLTLHKRVSLSHDTESLLGARLSTDRGSRDAVLDASALLLAIDSLKWLCFSWLRGAIRRSAGMRKGQSTKAVRVSNPSATLRQRGSPFCSAHSVLYNRY